MVGARRAPPDADWSREERHEGGNYPDRLREVAADYGFKLPKAYDEPKGTDCVEEASVI